MTLLRFRYLPIRKGFLNLVFGGLTAAFLLCILVLKTFSRDVSDASTSEHARKFDNRNRWSQNTNRHHHHYQIGNKLMSSQEIDDRIQLLTAEGLKKIGFDPVERHSFKSPFIFNPTVYSEEISTLWSKSESRTPKIITVLNVDKLVWFRRHGHNMNSEQCRFKCDVDLEGRRTKEADLVIFLCKAMGSHPDARPPGQLWALLCYESAANWFYPGYNFWKDQINMTISYRFDADISHPYVKLGWRESSLLLQPREYRDIAKSKPKTVVWWVSNCKGNRFKYVKEMRKYVDIDIYGDCGIELGCKNKAFDYSCRRNLNTTYKFYLAFENSFCVDYVTEKFNKMFMDRTHIIPVVKGALDYDKYFPKDTFINGNNVASAKELALYLKELAADVPRYSRMLQEKDRLQAHTYLGHDWCKFCETVHTRQFGIHRNIQKWSHDNTCQKSVGYDIN